MDVIATTVFGMDIDTQSTTDHPFLVNASKIMSVNKLTTFREKAKRFLTFTSICKLLYSVLI